jgi:hypothetical protein
MLRLRECLLLRVVVEKMVDHEDVDSKRYLAARLAEPNEVLFLAHFHVCTLL